MERNYAIYSRKSKFTGKGESIENQIEMCKAEILRKDSSVTEADILVYEDEGYSGKNTNRPQFQQMMKDVRSKKIKEIVCCRLDRISRNVGDCSRLIDELQEYSVNFNSISEHFDTSIPMGRAMYNMCSTFARLERETIAEREDSPLLAGATQGLYPPGSTYKIATAAAAYEIGRMGETFEDTGTFTQGGMEIDNYGKKIHKFIQFCIYDKLYKNRRRNGNPLVVQFQRRTYLQNRRDVLQYSCV